MELKRILARDSRTATAKAIELYGRDALIVSNERVNGQSEVIVAVDISATSFDLDERIPSQQLSASMSSNALPPGVKKRSARAFDSVLRASLSEDEMGGMDDSTDALAAAGLLPGAPASSVQAQPVTEAEEQSGSLRAREIVALVREELAEMRREFRISRHLGSWQSGQQVPEAIRPLVDAMSEQGVPAAMRGLMTDQIMECESTADALQTLRSTLHSAMQRDSPAASSATAAATPNLLGGIQIIAGPSGGGKTLMVSRLAQHHAEQLGAEQVAVISYSDHRPGAWSQIQTLCARAGVDCYRVADSSVLKTLMEELDNRKLILIDTAGIEMARNLESLCKLLPTAVCHLLLPVDASVTTIRHFLEQPAVLWKSLMLSKLDESANPWPMVQALCNHRVALSYVSESAQPGQMCQPADTAALIELALQVISPPALLSAPVQDAALNSGAAVMAMRHVS